MTKGRMQHFTASPVQIVSRSHRSLIDKHSCHLGQYGCQDTSADSDLSSGCIDANMQTQPLDAYLDGPIEPLKKPTLGQPQCTQLMK